MLSTPVMHRALLLTWLMFGVVTSPAQLSREQTWEIKPIFQIIRKVAYLGNHFVAGGFGGDISHSVDGVAWHGVYTGTTRSTTDFAYVQGRYYALQSPDILISTNLTEWERLPSKLSGTRALFYKDGVFIAAGSRIYRSTNGVDWIRNPEVFLSDIQALTYGNGIYVAIGAGYGAGASSTNGINWQRNSSPAAWDIAFGNGVFCASGPGMFTSANGRDWTTNLFRTNFTGVTFGAGRFIGSGDNGDIVISEDGTNWTFTPKITTNLLHSVAYGNGRYLAGGWGVAVTSSNAVDWTRSFHAPLETRAIIDVNGTIIVTGSHGQGTRTAWETKRAAFYTSPDRGHTWKFHEAPWTNTVFELKQQGGHIVGVGSEGLLMSSTNAVDWIIENHPHIPWRATAFGNGLHVVVGGLPDPMVAISSNATNWNIFPITNVRGFADVAFGSGQFATVGRDVFRMVSSIAASSDGRDWALLIDDIAERLTAIAYGNNTFVAVGDAGVILTSTNLTNWTRTKVGPATSLVTVEFARGVFVAAAGDGRLWSSVDGQRWRMHVPEGFGFPPYPVVASALVDGKFYFTGSGLGILRSRELLPVLTLRPDGTDRHKLEARFLNNESRLDASSDLRNWSPVTEPVMWTDDTSATLTIDAHDSRRFFRVKQQP